MWYWDYIPGGNYRKKPLSKKQLEKMQEAYSKADEIIKHVRELEKKNENNIEDAFDKKLESIFL